jgi:hypothetical protein
MGERREKQHLPLTARFSCLTDCIRSAPLSMGRLEGIRARFLAPLGMTRGDLRAKPKGLWSARFEATGSQSYPLGFKIVTSNLQMDD